MHSFCSSFNASTNFISERRKGESLERACFPFYSSCLMSKHLLKCTLVVFLFLIIFHASIFHPQFHCWDVVLAVSLTEAQTCRYFHNTAETHITAPRLNRWKASLGRHDITLFRMDGIVPYFLSVPFSAAPNFHESCKSSLHFIVPASKGKQTILSKWYDYSRDPRQQSTALYRGKFGLQFALQAFNVENRLLYDTVSLKDKSSLVTQPVKAYLTVLCADKSATQMQKVRKLKRAASDEIEKERRKREDVDKEIELRKEKTKEWRVILYNDDIHTFKYVTESLAATIPLITKAKAHTITVEAHRSGQASVISTWKQRAEVYSQELQRTGLTVSIMPDKNFKNNKSKE
ncbi:ATP-dependent Clp protease adaptor protein ClpS protein [Cardiosporidium cionae]|uniref:ATP-dependent Clp protease adaptor protein ClpS protein n=1 Tax=Cardiosporidium cionae TaxID=476202 RepID=A0ABQ7J7X0_9APIC|nr:ATP-dependent Clp protease adaptor protein ClpS protein [Cardiosporidium cionae]|eukprot:KAF8820069.1 ATP-dependent Clp protease adaptor protein ClpS protein [Cardiosporidium cionae]